MTALAQPNLLEKVSGVLAALGDPFDRGHASATLRETLLPHLEPREMESLDNVLRRLDTLCDAVVSKVRPLSVTQSLFPTLMYGVEMICGGPCFPGVSTLRIWLQLVLA